MHRFSPVSRPLAICAAMLVGLALTLPAGAARAAEEPGLLNVTGEAQIPAIPDMATIRLGVVTEDRRADQALAENATQMAAVLAKLQGFDIAPRDLQTSDLNLSPLYEPGQDYRGQSRRIIGFRASNSLTVRVRDLERLGEILDASVSDGANNFGGLSFGVQAPGPLESAAREAAMKDALARAETLATAAGVSLGPIRSITEQGGFRGPQMMRAEMAMADAGVPVAAGEVTMSSSVSLVIELAQ
ncbi:SIMPL domain-containing protein [Dinoroseobacter sp. S76]|uniref:SIMPL domain-containing protein n=1 Tax=Dinoroseobacter sp. S76 TaxID=3415124 RepID=UPI003C7C97F4